MDDIEYCQESTSNIYFSRLIKKNLFQFKSMLYIKYFQIFLNLNLYGFFGVVKISFVADLGSLGGVV